MKKPIDMKKADFEIAQSVIKHILDLNKEEMSEDQIKEKSNRNVLRPTKEGEGSCLDCEWGTSLFGGGKGAVCLHTGKKNINELVRCNEWIKRK